MPLLWQAVKDFFFSVFHNDPTESDRRRALRRLQADVTGVKPPYVKRGGQQVLPGLATVVYNFWTALQPVCQILRQTIDNTNDKLADRFRDSLIEKRLPETFRDRRTEFAYDNMRQRLANFASFEDELRRIDNDFDLFIKQLGSPELASFDIEYTQLERWAAVCRHDFPRLLALFDAAFAAGKADYKPEFQAVDAEHAVPELLDLYFLISGLDVRQGLEENLAALVERLGGAKAAEGVGKLRRSITRLDRILGRQLAAPLMLNLLRVLNRDPYLTPETDRDVKVFLSSYRDRIERRFERDKQRLARERREDSVTKEIATLFGEADLLEVRGYDEDTARVLQEDGYNGFTQLKALRLLKSFTAMRFEHGLKEPVNKLMVEGYYDDKSFLESLSTVFYGCSNVFENITGFEDSVLDGGRASVAAIHRLREKPSRQTSAAINKIVDAMNSRATRIVEEGTGALYSLAGLLREVVNDYKQSTPQHVVNVKVIAGNKNREFMGQLVSGYNDTIKFIRIMKNFTVLRPAVDKATSAEGGATAAAGSSQA